MKIFNLPDLGEGLPDAIIREWYVKEGDEIRADAPLVAMETAKALVDMPAPFSGKVVKLFGQVGDTIDTGKPLIGFEGEAEDANNADKGTVVGKLESQGEWTESTPSQTITSSTNAANTTHIKATPAVRLLAKQLGVDLSTVTASGPHITVEDVKAAAQGTQQTQTAASPARLSGHLEALSGVRKAMAMSMAQAHQNVASAALMDEANIDAWPSDTDISVRLIRAISHACQQVPLLNAYYDGSQMAIQRNEQINIGIAVDTEHGLFVPVLKDVGTCSDTQLRSEINRFKQAAQTRSFPPADLQGATILMSNVGVIAGQYAVPVVTPPMVAIVAFGRIKPSLALNQAGIPVMQRLLPISLTFDHRPITGGDAARFLRALISHLEQAVI
jgi:pyruvate dehydrogenase E2 component (dihydrolipoamide acetyltransferase)